MTQGSFGYRCEYCEGTVEARAIDREAFKHRNGFVILENLVVGVCHNCGNRYYSADTLKRVDAVASGRVQSDRTEKVPVASAG